MYIYYKDIYPVFWKVNLSYKTRYFTSANVIKAHAIDQDRSTAAFYQKANAFQNQQKEIKSAQGTLRQEWIVRDLYPQPSGTGVTNLVDANWNVDLSTMSQIMEMYIKIGCIKKMTGKLAARMALRSSFFL